MLEQNIKKKGFLGSLSFNLESEVWLLVRDSLSKGYLYTTASQQPPGACPISSDGESVLGLESTDRQTDRSAAGPGSQFSLLGVSSGLMRRAAT